MTFVTSVALSRASFSANGRTCSLGTLPLGLCTNLARLRLFTYGAWEVPMHSVPSFTALRDAHRRFFRTRKLCAQQVHANSVHVARSCST